jgi:hypothetical protein
MKKSLLKDISVIVEFIFFDRPPNYNGELDEKI